MTKMYNISYLSKNSEYLPHYCIEFITDLPLELKLHVLEQTKCSSNSDRHT